MLAKPKVLVSASTFPLTENDGRPRFVLDLAAALNRMCPVEVLVPSAAGYPRQAKLSDVALHRFPYFFPESLQRLAYNVSLIESMKSSFLAKVQAPLFVGAEALATRRLIKNNAINVVNSHWIVPQGLSTALARGKDRNFVHILSAHAGDVHFLMRVPFGKTLARFVLERTDFVFGDSAQVLEDLKNLADRDFPHQAQPMGVDIEKMTKGVPNDYVAPFGGNFILFVGRFVEKKGLPFLIRAMAKVAQANKEIGLVLVGDGPLRGPAELATQELGISKQVLFVGQRSHEEVCHYMQSARIICVPSIVDKKGETEGVPTVIMEGLAAGKRVISTAVAGIPDLLGDGKCGRICRAEDADDLAEKILAELQVSPSGKFDVECNMRAREHDWTHIAMRYHAIILECLDRKALS